MLSYDTLGAWVSCIVTKVAFVTIQVVLSNLLNQGNRAAFLRLNFNEFKRFNLYKLVAYFDFNVVLVYTCFMPHTISVSTCATMFVTTCSKTMFSDGCIHTCIVYVML